MAHQVNQINVNVRFEEIKLLSFQITDYASTLSDRIDSDKYEFQFALRTDLLPEAKRFITTLDVFCIDISKTQKAELASMKCQFELQLLNLDEISTINNGQITLPDAVLRIAFSSAVSTARGIFMMCAAPTKFSNAIIPLINAQDFKISETAPKA